MVFFSVRIRRLVAKAYQADMQDALFRAAERWCGTSLADVLEGTTPSVPDVRLRTDDGAHDVKFVFHFPAFDDREGHAVIWIQRDPRAFSLSTLGLIVTARTDATQGPSRAGVEDGHDYPSETIAHELGHSMGLGDEYFETLGHRGVPSLRQFTWDFPHFSFDDQSIMLGEREPRLRHYWVFSRWLEQSAEVARVRRNEYAIVCDTSAVVSPRSGRTHTFRLPAAHAWPYDATREERRFRPGRGGRGRLRLYLLGDDYDVHKLPRTGVLAGVDAVLYWDLSVYVRRRANADGSLMSRPDVNNYLDKVYGEMGHAVGAVRLPTAASVGRCLVIELDTSTPAQPLARDHVKKVLVYVLPRFTRSNPAAADFRVHVRPRSTMPGADVTDLHEPGFRRRKIDVHEEVPGQAILRYMMGLGAAAAHPGAKIHIATTPLRVGPAFSIGSSSVSSRTLQIVHGSRTSGANDFDGSGTPAQVAADLTAAINDDANDFASHILATATGGEVALKAKSAGDDVALSSAPPGTSVLGPWSEDFEASELDFLADWLGEQLGATYRVKAYD